MLPEVHSVPAEVEAESAGRHPDPFYTTAFRHLCAEIVERQILEDGEIVSLAELARTFVVYVDRYEHLDATRYRRDKLKKRITKRYGDRIAFLNIDGGLSEVLVGLEQLEKSGSFHIVDAALSETEDEPSDGALEQICVETGSIAGSYTGFFLLVYWAQLPR